MDMYNNVASDYLKDINQPYIQIKSISEEGEIESTTWPNYQTYLLSNKNADNKGSRSNPPLTTTLDKADDNNPNRENIYFFRTEDTIKVEKKKKKTKKVKQQAGIKNIPVNLQQGSKKFEADGETVNKIKIVDGKFKEVVSFILVPGQLTEENFNDKIKLKSDKTLASIIKKNPKLTQDQIESTVKQLIFFELDDVQSSTKSSDDSDDSDVKSSKPKNKTKTTKRKRGRRSRENRIVVESQIKQVENWEKFETWLSKNFPNVPVIRVKIS